MKNKGTLTKVKVSDDAESPNTAGDGCRQGFFLTKPTIGQAFIFVNQNKITGIKTSTIKDILDETDNSITFETNNSIYKLDIDSFEEE
jgi:hypothetical protein